MKPAKKNSLPRRLVVALLSVCLVVSLCEGLHLLLPTAYAADEHGTSGATRQADPSTMDKYIQMLNFSAGTRYAGRLWSDESVFALGSDDTGDRSKLWNGDTGTLELTPDLDGLTGSVELNDDFLHVYSILRSSLEVIGVPPRPRRHRVRQLRLHVLQQLRRDSGGIVR